MRPASQETNGVLDGSRAGCCQFVEVAHLSPERSFFLGSVSSKPTLVQKLLFKLLKQEQVQNMKIYVGNLSFKTSGEDLQKLFSQAGTVESASVIEDRET